jgi:hypothetical protein
MSIFSVRSVVAVFVTTMAFTLSGCPAPEPEIVGADIPCTRSQCSEHGTCTVDALRPTCACDEGYAGITCGTCADGFHRDVADNCVADEVCTEGFCGDNGGCVVEQGRALCVCNDGYAGSACSVCAAGFHDENGACVPDEVCLENTCSGRGTCNDTTGVVTCTCDPGFSSRFCEVDELATCIDNPVCGDHGTCVETGAGIRCACDVGYTGDTCGDCYPGYGRNADEDCVPQEACSPSTCSFSGECALDGATATCACFVGYTGAFCELCAEGFHRGGANNDCVIDERCEDNDPCAAGGTCVDDGGVVACACDVGYAGSLCEQCYPGYHDDGTGICVLDERCREATCGLGGVCDDAGGVVSCQCAAGFEGDYCETNIDDCVNNACGTGTCIDLVGGRTCHCLNGTFGNACP